MTTYIDGLLMLGFLVILYISLKKYNNIENETKNLEIFNSGITTELLNNKMCNEFIPNYPQLPTQYIKFDYNPTKEILNQYQQEQKYGSNMAIKYPNKYAKTNEEKNIVYGSWNELTGNPDEFLDTKIIYNEPLYKPNITHMDGVLNINDINTIGKSIQEIYDNNILDFKNLVEDKKKINDDTIMPTRKSSQVAASKLSYMLDDDWEYENEKPENGGQILDNFYASDPFVNNTPAIF
jgi:hypothetical protein